MIDKLRNYALIALTTVIGILYFLFKGEKSAANTAKMDLLKDQIASKEAESDALVDSARKDYDAAHKNYPGDGQ